MNRALLDNRPSRAKLLGLPLSERNRGLGVAVHRNHSFELVASVLGPFLNESGLGARFGYSGYDDSLSFAAVPPENDLHLIWLDAARLSAGRESKDLAAWLSGRLAALRALTSKPIIFAGCAMPPETTGELILPADALCCDLDAELGLPPAIMYSDRLAAFTGTRLSNVAALLAARLLGLRHIPALTVPALKVLVLDLDNTLYSGVLGEDGPKGVQPYNNLQRHLKKLAEQGFLLALASKNEERDVRDLFAVRKDFALTWSDFTASAVNWRPKAEGIMSIAEALNVGTDSMLFVDDNPGETARAARAIPDLRVLTAGGEEETLNALRWQPGLLKVRHSAEDTLRSADIRANAGRMALMRSVSPREYLRALELELAFAVNPGWQLPRLTDLLNKTNQFILSYKRPNQSETEVFLRNAGKCLVSVAMKDALSDSGVIAAALLERQGEQAVLRELAVSCRALGRGVEGDMIAKMLALGCETLATGPIVEADYERGPRNGPGLAWLQSASSARLANRGRARLDALLPADLELVTLTILKGAPK